MNCIIGDIFKENLDTVISEISDGKEFEITFPLSSIGVTNNPMDIVHDYVEASYCTEKISPLIEIIDSSIVTRDKYYTDFKIKCKTTNSEAVAKELLYLSEMISGELEMYSQEEREEFYSEMEEHEDTFTKAKFEFPELINDYWANLINGGYYVMASEYSDSESKYFSKVYRKYPEHRFGFWRGAWSKSFTQKIYFSVRNWIIPPETDLISALKVYSGLDREMLIEEADKIEYNGQTILISNSTAVHFKDKEELLRSIKCTEFVLNKTQSKSEPSPDSDLVQIDLFGESRRLRPYRKRTNYNSDVILDDKKLRFQISEFGDLIVVEYNGFSYVFFSRDILSFEEIKEVNSYLYPAFSKTQKLIDISISETCNWAEIDDDRFEELCYDILFCHTGFDSQTIQKMGKSRSRDGGRDIVIKTKRTLHNEPELYIFQCKFFRDGASLSSSKVANAGNVIMQYGAKGYGVFTNGVIDSTLYDMLDGFSKNAGTDTSFRWSKYELERYLNRYQMIKKKYFRK